MLLFFDNYSIGMHEAFSNFPSAHWIFSDYFKLIIYSCYFKPSREPHLVICMNLETLSNTHFRPRPHVARYFRGYFHRSTSWEYACVSAGKLEVYAKLKYEFNWVRAEMAKPYSLAQNFLSFFRPEEAGPNN